MTNPQQAVGELVLILNRYIPHLLSLVLNYLSADACHDISILHSGSVLIWHLGTVQGKVSLWSQLLC